MAVLAHMFEVLLETITALKIYSVSESDLGSGWGNNLVNL